MSVITNSTARRTRRISAAVLIVACTLVVLSCVQSAYRLWLPTEGWDYATTNDTATNTVIFSRNLLGEPTPLRAGDRLLAINGVPYPEEGLVPPTSLDAQFRPGAAAHYTVRRDGQVFDLAVPLKRWTLGAVLDYRFPNPGKVVDFAASWFVFGLSMFVLRRRPTEPAARALLLFVAANLTAGLGLVPDGATTQYSAVWPLTILLSYLIWAIVLAPSLFVLALSFPQPKRVVRRTPWLLLLPYAAFWVLLAIFGPNFNLIGFGLSGVFFALSLLAVIHSIFTQRDRVSRAQLLWGFGGFLALLVSFLPLYANVFLSLGGIELDSASWFVSVGNVLSTIGPAIFQVMLAVAILRYRLFDIDIIIRRTLVYSLLTLTLGAIYFIGVVALQALFVRLTGQESALAVVASTVVIAALFGPLRRRVQALIDRRFYRRKYDAQQVLEQFALRAQQQADLDTVSADVLATVDETLQPEQVTLWMIWR